MTHWFRTARPVALLLVLVGATIHFGWFVDRFYDIGDWLFWRYAAYWLFAGVFAVSCYAAGDRLVRDVVKLPLPLLEHIAVAYALGIFAFFGAVFAVGIVGGLGTAAFFGVPAVLLAVGGLRPWRRLARYGRRLGRRRRPLRPTEWLALGLGAAVLALIYFAILTPKNLSYDALWKHLAIAEQYRVDGAIRPFAEGWYPAAHPHLASVLYTWAFSIPGGDTFDRVLLCAHLEVVIFAGTLVGISALVRRLGVRTTHAGVWAVRFLFPGVLLYDASLSAGADHIGAIWAVPIFLFLLRAWPRLRPRECAMLSLMMAGAAMTKYSSAVTLLAFPAAAIALRSVMLLVAALRGRAARTAWIAGPAAATAWGLVVTAPHWLKNWLFYGDPLFPSLHRWFSSSYWAPGAEETFRFGYMGQHWRPDRDLDGLFESLRALVSFSYVPHDWPVFHRNLPVFGSLFTIAMLCLPFVPAKRRLWALFGGVLLAIFAWYNVHHQDRHLQTLMPLMTAATGAVIILAWRTHRVIRAAVIALIGLQLVWGGDIYFFATHAMAKSPPRRSAELLASGFDKSQRKLRSKPFGRIHDISKALPPEAVVVMHDHRLFVGLDRRALRDFPGWQGAISYGSHPTPAGVYERLRQLGATHIVWRPGKSRGWDSLGGDVAFFWFVKRHLVDVKSFGERRMGRLPDTRPSHPGPGNRVAFIGCRKTYADGLYHIEDLAIPAFGPRKPDYPAPHAVFADADADELVKRANAVVVQTRCGRMPPGSKKAFNQAAVRKRREALDGARDSTKDAYEIWIRGRGEPLALD